MSAAIDRLRILQRQAGTSAPTAATPDTTPARTADPASLHRLLRIRERKASSQSHSADRTLPGKEIVPGLHLISSHLPLPPPSTPIPLGFARRDSSIAPQHLLFFDTETTGLAGGTGTRAFQIGAADWHDDPLQGPGLRVRQLLMTTMAAEPAMLRAFAGWLAPDTVLCSYNGRCYDAPLLKARYRLARLPDPISPLDHLDLLFPTRRFHKGRWADCRLATVERELLGIVREDDLPGAQAPAAWLSWLRGGPATNLRRVCAHNHQDVVTLARLLLALASSADDTAIALPGLHAARTRAV
ncbi:exonuclease [Lysobacter alkalisoli]|uniref:Exonuclease n=1 Tax=Marilutibacter alkalisoli TaxID=2591633 RepID=A0A514BN19_9GAMM|nr:exonuclease [Lysobacter alkalisoli]